VQVRLWRLTFVRLHLTQQHGKLLWGGSGGVKGSFSGCSGVSQVVLEVLWGLDPTKKARGVSMLPWAALRGLWVAQGHSGGSSGGRWCPVGLSGLSDNNLGSLGGLKGSRSCSERYPNVANNIQGSWALSEGPTTTQIKNGVKPNAIRQKQPRGCEFKFERG
jgi:hypothetical protein